MFSSTLSWVFTAVFVLTGVYALVRLGELFSGADHTGSRVAELSHLLMSIAMIAMAWAFVGGPSSASGLVVIVVFGVFVVWFLGRLVWPAAGHLRVLEGDHLLLNAAMVWMVAAMPQLMGAAAGATSGAPEGGGMAGMPGMGAMPGIGGAAPGTGAGAPTAAAPGWVTAVTWVFIVLVLVGAALWAMRIARPHALHGWSSRGALTTDSDGLADADHSSVEGAVGVVVAPARTRVSGPRFDAGCHLLMSLGMAGMLLAML